MNGVREFSKVITWHAADVLLPRAGTKVLGYWGAGEYHVAERGWSEDGGWVNAEDGSTLIPPRWWMSLAVPIPQEDE